MFRKLATILVVVLLATQLAIAPVAAIPLLDDADSTPPVVKSSGELTFIVTLDDPDSLSTLESWANSSTDREVLSSTANGTVATIRAPGWQVNQGLLDRVTSTTSPSDIVTRARATPLTQRNYITTIDPNYQLSNSEPVESFLNVTDYTSPQIGLTGIDDPRLPMTGMAFQDDADRTTMQESRDIIGANNTTATGDGITVAVIDTGVNTASGNLFGANESSSTPDRILPASKSFISNETVADAGYDAVEDQNGHGTWVASATAANTTNDTHDGVAPDADVLALKALDGEGSGSTSDIARAVRYAADHNASVISMSLGSPVYSTALADAIQYALDNGVQAVTVATGNSRQTTRWTASPSDVDGVIAVGATNGSAPGSAGTAYFSQIGPDPSTLDGSELESAGEMPDVAAPGMATVAMTADTSGFTSESELSGTSMATPMVAGSVALALEQNPSWSANEVRDRITESARPVPNAAEVEVGAGMVAADRLTSGSNATETQSEAMTDPAVTRGEFYRSLSDAAGGVVGRILNGGPIV
jgi:subtilisin family serine protease